MSNNPKLYDAAIAGATGGIHERWIVDQDPNSYLTIRNAIVIFATEVDGAIPASASTSAASAALLQSICAGILAGRYLPSISANEVSALALAISALYTTINAQLTDPDFGAQTTWFIDATNGNDGNDGETAATALATMGELNSRLVDAVVPQNVTVQLIGDVVDTPPSFSGMKLWNNASFTVQGTLTAVATGTVSIVTALGATPAFPYQLTTTGLDWTTVTARCLRFNDGTFAQVGSVIDANNVVIGAKGAPTGVLTTAPIAAQTFEVLTRSLSLPPAVNALAQATANGNVLTSLMFRDMKWDAALTESYSGNVPVMVFNVEITESSNRIVRASTFVTWRLCLYTFTSNITVTVAALGGIINGSVFSGTGGLTIRSAGNFLYNTNYHDATRLTFASGMFASIGGGCFFRNVANPLIISEFSKVFSVASSIIQGTGNSGTVAIDVTSGSALQYVSKPTLAATNDTRIGGTITAYAGIPFVNAANNAMMVVSA